MHMLSLAIIFLLVACVPERESSSLPPELTPAPSAEVLSEQVGLDSTLEEEGVGRYIEDYYGESSAEALAEEIIGNGERALLFFYAGWCPRCQQKEATLKKLYGEGAYPISTYKLNYDEAMTLKARYDVTTQDTVVLIDGDGNSLQMVVSAQEEDLKYLLSVP